jgi:hypothetical protein
MKHFNTDLFQGNAVPNTFSSIGAMWQSLWLAAEFPKAVAIALSVAMCDMVVLVGVRSFKI